ncbi:NADPH:quinone reductase [Actinoallomurus sp. CA-142502]|uniref:NADPH:quinone reductase n=1 Tax=Actinoallomurus sp. CA-142502 TaxID=3239885 RepID=UPI003D913BA7
MTRAAYITRLGPPEEIRWGELPDPVSGPADVLVRTEAVAANHVDTFVRSGRYRTPTPFPFVIGRDLADEVVGAGPGFSPGDRVWCAGMGHGGRQGSFAELVAVPAERLYRLPEGVGAVEAVGVLHPAATAFLALFRHGGLRLGETVYVGGGAGNVGDALVRMASAAGARVIASASERDADRCRAAGAAVVIDYRDPSLTARVREAAPDGIDVHVDTSGRPDLEAAVGLLAHGGRIVLLAGVGVRAELPVGPLYMRDGRLLGFAISNASAADLAGAASVINTMLAAGALPCRVTDVLALADAAEAHRRLEAGQVRGRLVLRP